MNKKIFRYGVFINEEMSKILSLIVDKYNWDLISEDMAYITKTDIYKLVNDGNTDELNKIAEKVNLMISFYFVYYDKKKTKDENKLQLISEEELYNKKMILLRRNKLKRINKRRNEI